MASGHKRLGELLVESRLIDAAQLDAAIAEQKKSGLMLGTILLEQGVVQEKALMDLLHRQLGMPLVDLETMVADELAIAKIKEDMARKYCALPVEIEGRKTLVVAMADPMNVAAIEDLRFHAGMFIKPVLASPSQINEAIERHYHLDTSMNEVVQSIIQGENDVVVNAVADDDERQAIDELMREAEGRPIVRLANWLLHRAVEEGASDVHIEPQGSELIVRLRIDGLLREEQRLPKWTQSAIVSRLKVLSNLDIAEKRQPQDGRLVAEIGGRRIDMRVSTLPVTGGEKLVMRVVDTRRREVDLEVLGMAERELAQLKDFLARPQGIVLVTGPTGSGKTTLLYSALQSIQDVTRNITTVEDPVEYQIPGLNQVHVDEKAKKTFAGALRAILRQDPDVIMIGEIRDTETAQIAFRASVTGHLVLSTVHTNDAAGAVTRLIDLGLEPFMVASSLVGVVSIRLVRTICPHCRELYEADAATLQRLSGATTADAHVTLHRGAGCAKCRNTGYAGRTGIFEVLPMNDTMRAHIGRGTSDSELRKLAIQEGMRPISEHGLEKVLAGQTTIDEVARVVYLPEQSVKMCNSCSNVVAHEFEFCPHCGHFVGEHCGGCKRRMDVRWTFCPTCGTEGRKSAAQATAKPARKRGPKDPPSGILRRVG
ncbi:MAG: Flp pilus assembly complex ATPase component TadA [Candidatus Eisenbacteria bacterium]|nr:Flp pilus assembly complex ATPase component TadA [Candidatus Eisenbacteria bacterium]